MTQSVVGGTTTNYTYNGDGLRVGNSTVGGYSSSMVRDVNLGLPQVISDSNYVYIYGLGPIGMIDPQGNAYYFLKDGLGSVTGIVDASGVVTATYDYDAYGNLLSSTGTITNAIRYAGQWYDGETGFYYLRARYYDPTVGRFTQRDTWSGDTTSPYSLNPYLYGYNNPVKYVDPSGLDPLECLIHLCRIPPDYYTLTVNAAIPNPFTLTFVGLTIQGTYDRYGHAYLGGGLNVGKSATFFSGSLVGGNILQCSTPTEAQLERFISGPSANVMLGYWLGVASTWGNFGSLNANDFSAEAGLVSPQVGASMTYAFQVR